ncbi:MAG: FKBP-type peptidyl-prolyl cis-trans isomerase [Candidatus Saccharimonadaceae bacterium]
MAATKTQRIGIWVIAIFMGIGTIGSFAIIILSNQNDKSDQSRYSELKTDYQKQLDTQAKTLSDKYFPTFSPYASKVSTFEAASVTELKTEDLVVGDGDTLTAESSFTAYYVGWTPDGKTFDSSISGDSLKAPYTAAPGQVIKGWTNGVVGMKIGGVRVLTIPSDQGYGTTGSGSNIAPNTPLKFVMMVIPTPEDIQPSQELIDLYARINKQ